MTPIDLDELEAKWFRNDLHDAAFEIAFSPAIGALIVGLRASRKVIAAARTVTEMGGIPVALDNALDELDAVNRE